MNTRIITPILLRSFGRSGTTMMMQLLGTSDEIAFDRKYPYENRILAYFYRLSTLPFKEFKGDIKWNNGSILSSDLNVMGPLPLHTELVSDQERFKKDIFKRIWNGVSREILFTNEKAVYYAEKVPLDIPTAINSIMRCKNIFLLRDPRDEMVSIMEFNAKRGTMSFGWEEQDTPVSFARKLVVKRKKYIKNFIQLNQTEQRIKIKYEDVVRDMSKEAKRLSEWLGIDLDPTAVISAQSEHSHHMTSKDPSASIGRWKHALPSDVQDIFMENMYEELRDVGYEVQ